MFPYIGHHCDIIDLILIYISFTCNQSNSENRSPQPLTSSTEPTTSLIIILSSSSFTFVSMPLDLKFKKLDQD